MYAPLNQHMVHTKVMINKTHVRWSSGLEIFPKRLFPSDYTVPIHRLIFGSTENIHGHRKVEGAR